MTISSASIRSAALTMAAAGDPDHTAELTLLLV
jgi:hypothetical protein